MIKMDEIRHGNYYLFTGNFEGIGDYTDKIGRVMMNDHFSYYVDFKDISNQMLSYFNLEQIKPVPATKELLEDLGFDKSVWQK